VRVLTSMWRLQVEGVPMGVWRGRLVNMSMCVRHGKLVNVMRVLRMTVGVLSRMIVAVVVRMRLRQRGKFRGSRV